MRLIPARAGKTRTRPTAWPLESAHPRSRGENSSGYPPPKGRRWLIPARAGKTYLLYIRRRSGRAHPRSRGENRLRLEIDRIDRGSSPLARGKRKRFDVRPKSTRLIPARAGKTEIIDQVRAGDRAHPRSRGENGSLPAEGMNLDGSSPLTRGKQRPLAGSPSGSGLIPAHAGKTRPFRCRRRGSRAHPRSRGENGGSWGCPAGDLGSSPLTRGKRGLVPFVVAHGGLIPAHAGKTSRGRTQTQAPPAHPRSRGENVSS